VELIAQVFIRWRFSWIAQYVVPGCPQPDVLISHDAQ